MTNETESTPIVRLVEFPSERLERLEASNNKILEALQGLSLVKEPDHLTVPEFLEKCKISRWTFDRLRNTTDLEIIKLGRKYYIPNTEVSRYFKNAFNKK